MTPPNIYAEALPPYTTAVIEIAKRLREIRIENGFTFDANVLEPGYGSESVAMNPGDVVLTVSTPAVREGRTEMASRKWMQRTIHIRAVPKAGPHIDEPTWITHDRMFADLIQALRLDDHLDRIADQVALVPTDLGDERSTTTVDVSVEISTLVHTADHRKGRNNG